MFRRHFHARHLAAVELNEQRDLLILSEATDGDAGGDFRDMVGQEIRTMSLDDGFQRLVERREDARLVGPRRR